MGVADGADKIALYEDDPTISIVLEDVFADEQLNVLRCSSLAEIHSAVGAGDIDVAVADTWGPGNGTLGDLEHDQIIKLGQHVPLIFDHGARLGCETAARRTRDCRHCAETDGPGSSCCRGQCSYPAGA